MMALPKYVERLIRLLKLNQLFDHHKELRVLSAEEFEDGKGEYGLSEGDRIKWRTRRRLLRSYFRYLFEEYVEGEIKREDLFEWLNKATMEKDIVLLGCEVKKAFSIEPKHCPKISKNPRPYLARHLKWLKTTWQKDGPEGILLFKEIKAEIEELTGEKIKSESTLENWLKPGWRNSDR